MKGFSSECESAFQTNEIKPKRTMAHGKLHTGEPFGKRVLNLDKAGKARIQPGRWLLNSSFSSIMAYLFRLIRSISDHGNRAKVNEHRMQQCKAVSADHEEVKTPRQPRQPVLLSI